MEVMTSQENDFLRGVMVDRPIWMGASDRKSEGKWVWETSGKFLTDGFTAWGPGGPDDKDGEDCLEWNIYAGVWNDAPCGQKLPFVCERDIPTQVVG